MLLAELILRMRWRGRCGRSRRCAAVAVAAAAVHDDAGAFPRLDKPFAGIGAVKLLHEIVQVGDLFQQIGGVGVHFFQERAAVHNLAAREIHHGGERIDRIRQSGDAGGGHAASRRAGLGHGGAGEVADGGGFVEQVLLAELHDFRFGHVHLREFFEVVGFLEMIRQRAGENVGGIFEGGFGLRLGVARAAARAIGQRRFLDDGGVVRFERGNVGGEIQRGIAIPNGLVFSGVGGGDTRANHVYLVCESYIHIDGVFVDW